jgi:DHA1 family multidrug resistance protein-like MFS transporter
LNHSQNHSHLPAPHWQRTLYILFIAQVFTAVGFSSIFPFLPLYVKELGAATDLSIEFLAGAVFSSQAVTMMLASPFWGTLADRYGRKLMVERSMFGGAIILLMMAFVANAEQLVLLRAIQGFITGTVAAANALIAAVAPRDRTGYAMGLLQVGMGTGVALGPLIGGAIADAYGYNAAFYITAALLFIAGIFVVFGVEEKFEKPAAQATQTGGFMREWKHVLSAPGILTVYAMRFISQLGNMLIVPIAPLFIQTLLTDSSRLNTFTGLVVGASSATTTISAVYFGKLGDRVGHKRVVVVSAVCAMGLYLLHNLVNAGWQLLVLQALVGVALGGIIPSLSALLATITHSGEAGAVYGLDNSINAAGRSIAPMLGSGIAYWFTLRTTFTATAILFLITALIGLRYLPRFQGAKVVERAT